MATEKKIDPKAKVRNRGKVVFSWKSKYVKDKKDHFPINNIDQARNALSRVAQYDKVPSWFDGSLKQLQEMVRKAVKKAYPSIEVSGLKKSKSSYLNMLHAEIEEGSYIHWSEFAYASTLED